MGVGIVGILIAFLRLLMLSQTLYQGKRATQT
ncbi:MAG: hypothetical protein CM1200mP40_25530 [Gammaproteobacteria bacterium]|nr:MAG: hypothetical protein CM1200mP40_25530 [Gammaproteobacteria bacterium]